MKKLALVTILFSLIISVPAFAGTDGTMTLKDSVVAAVKQHPVIKSMLHNREAVDAAGSSAFGRFFPSLDLGVDYGWQQYNSPNTRNNNTEKKGREAVDFTATLTQNVFDGFDRWNDYKYEGARLTSAEARLIDNVETVALDAIRAHVDVVRLRKLVALAGENITAHQQLLDSITERVEGGAGNKADEMQAKGRVARAETTLVTYMGELRTAEADYIRQVGATPEVLGDPDYNPELIPGTADQVLEIVMDNNPKILSGKADIAAAEYAKGVRQSNYYPEVNLRLRHRNTDNLDGSDSWIQDDSAMVTADWNLFNGTSDYYDVQVSNARIRETQTNLQDTSDDLIRQVASSWAEYESAIGQIEKYQEALQYSLESLDMYLMQFNVGQRSLLDVLDATNEVFTNKVQLETATQTRNFALYRFLALEGHLVKSLDVAANTYDSQAGEYSPRLK